VPLRLVGSEMCIRDRPQTIRFVADTDMPRTATGKILHRILRDQMSQSHALA
jgi:acyl-coenzyme A synthetase/AMP-(fatty) acid ligase